MNNNIWQRRQFLYLGLGLIGACASATLNTKVDVDSGNNNRQTSPVSATARNLILPEFQGIQQWLNSPPLTKADLTGHVVLLQFWTFACINCQRTLPYITSWHQKYAPQGLKVVSVHTPEFAYERKIDNIQTAIKKHGIKYPVAVDNDFKTWRAYNNEYWPHLFLADRQGKIVYNHIGEGAYRETENQIQNLLKS